jgi:hypothetical protein
MTRSGHLCKWKLRKAWIVRKVARPQVWGSSMGDCLEEQVNWQSFTRSMRQQSGRLTLKRAIYGAAPVDGSPWYKGDTGLGPLVCIAGLEASSNNERSFRKKTSAFAKRRLRSRFSFAQILAQSFHFTTGTFLDWKDYLTGSEIFQ